METQETGDIARKDTLVRKLQAVITKVDEEKMELEKLIRKNSKEMEEAIMNKVETMDISLQPLASSNTAMEVTVKTVHEGQLMIDTNIQRLMIKMGINIGGEAEMAI